MGISFFMGYNVYLKKKRFHTHILHKGNVYIMFYGLVNEVVSPYELKYNELNSLL